MAVEDYDGQDDIHEDSAAGEHLAAAAHCLHALDVDGVRGDRGQADARLLQLAGAAHLLQRHYRRRWLDEAGRQSIVCGRFMLATIH